MPRTEKGVTKVLVDRLLALGWTKWRLAFKVKWSPKKDGMGGLTYQQSWQTVDAWSKGLFEANRHNAEVLKELLFEECKKQGKWFFDPSLSGVHHPEGNKVVDSHQHESKKYQV